MTLQRILIIFSISVDNAIAGADIDRKVELQRCCEQ